MNSTIRLVAGAALASVFAGCIHFGETEFPAVTIPAVDPQRNVKVQVAGFDAALTTFVPVYGATTIVGGSPWGGPHVSTVTTQTIVPQLSPTTAFRDRATETLERCGFVVQAADPQYRIEVTFTGPIVTGVDTWKAVAWNLFTLLTADYSAQDWTAKLKVHDLRTGRLVYFQDYSQRYEVKVWGPIPIFSPGASEKTKFSAGEGWCLTALTDRALADAIGYLKETTSKGTGK